MKFFFDRTRAFLLEHEVPSDVTERIVESGFVHWGSDFRDTFYGHTVPSGVFPQDRFLRHAQGEVSADKATYRRVQIESLAHFRELLAANPDWQRWSDSGIMSFRGQSKERFIQRPFPNPYRADDQGKEVSMIPSLWRRYEGRWNDRFSHKSPPLFQTMYGDPLIYAGLGVMERRKMSQEEHSEAERRHLIFKQSTAPDGLIVEQHYGIDTQGLDVTFDPAVALFFASHRFFSRPDGTATFLPDVTGVVYSLVFSAPRLRSSEALITELEGFRHLPPVRPGRQKCALPCMQVDRINETVVATDTIFVLAPNFDRTGLPAPVDLFPSGNEDPFYRALLEQKARWREMSPSDESPFEAVPEYRF